MRYGPHRTLRQTRMLYTKNGFVVSWDNFGTSWNAMEDVAIFLHADLSPQLLALMRWDVSQAFKNTFLWRRERALGLAPRYRSYCYACSDYKLKPVYDAYLWWLCKEHFIAHKARNERILLSVDYKISTLTRWRQLWKGVVNSEIATRLATAYTGWRSTPDHTTSE